MPQLCHLRTPKSHSNRPEPAPFHRLRAPATAKKSGSGSTTLEVRVIRKNIGARVATMRILAAAERPTNRLKALSLVSLNFIFNYLFRKAFVFVPKNLYNEQSATLVWSKARPRAGQSCWAPVQADSGLPSRGLHMVLYTVSMLIDGNFFAG